MSGQQRCREVLHILGDVTRRKALITVAISTAVIAGCSVPTAGSTTTPIPVPQDRDNGAVVAALRGLDACALIDPTIAERVGIGSRPAVYAEAPHACTISSAPSSGNDTVTVRLGEDLHHYMKWASAPITLAGAKAYLFDDSLQGDNCVVSIPVSFNRAIGIHANGRTGGSADIDLCAAATAFAEAAATKLANPDLLQADRTVLPLSQWDGCSLLATALGDRAGQYTLTLDDGVPSLDGCDASRGDDRELSLKISYTWDPAQYVGPNGKQLGGRTVDVSEPNEFGCRARWSNGPATAIKVFSDQVIEVQAPDCPQAEQLAVAVMSIPSTAAPTAEIQQLLLYRPDEPDTAATGPCIDDVDGDKPGRCTPYREVSIPRGGRELILAGATDPNVECAVALEPVRAYLGTQMAPTTDGSSCYFLESTHAIRVEVDFSGLYVPDHYGTEADLFQNRKKIDVAGYPAIYFESELRDIRTEYHIFASPRYDTSTPGYVRTTLSLELPRGAPSGTRIDTTRVPLLEKIMADIMSTHFG